MIAFKALLVGEVTHARIRFDTAIPGAKMLGVVAQNPAITQWALQKLFAMNRKAEEIANIQMMLNVLKVLCVIISQLSLTCFKL